jgi:hypothetical protein
MNASTIINDTMTLDEKLAAIDAAMANAQAQADDDARSNGFSTAAPLDPADLTMCDSCQ